MALEYAPEPPRRRHGGQHRREVVGGGPAGRGSTTRLLAVMEHGAITSRQWGIADPGDRFGVAVELVAEPR